jgi:hypothetical protein
VGRGLLTLNLLRENLCLQSFCPFFQDRVPDSKVYIDYETFGNGREGPGLYWMGQMRKRKLQCST